MDTLSEGVFDLVEVLHLFLKLLRSIAFSSSHQMHSDFIALGCEFII